MSGALLAASLPGGPVVTLSGHINNAGNVGANATASFKVDDDGKMYQRDNGGAWSQIDSDRDWLRPLTSAPGSYRVRFIDATGDTGSITATTAEDVWHSLSTSDWIITVTDTTTVFGGKSATFTIEIDDGATLQDSGSYTLTADREDT